VISLKPKYIYRTIYRNSRCADFDDVAPHSVFQIVLNVLVRVRCLFNSLMSCIFYICILFRSFVRLSLVVLCSVL